MISLRVPGVSLAGLTRAAGNVFTASRHADRLFVLNYHRILARPDPLLGDEPTVETFRWQMQLLARRFNVLALPEALARLTAGSLPPRAVCITFDDGYRSVHDLALPVLDEFGLPATVFVSTGYLEGGTMWNETIVDAVRRLPDGVAELGQVGLGPRVLRHSADRQHLLDELIARAKYLPPPARAALIERLAALAGCDSAAGLMLTPPMIRTMAARGVEIGAHTVSHPILTSLADDAAFNEIAQSKRDLEAITGSPVRYFAYPNGKAGKDFDQRHVQMVRDAGFAAAFSTEVGPAVRGRDLFQLPRSRPWDDKPFMFGLRLLWWLAQE